MESLPDIERSAGEAFRGSSQAAVADGDVADLASHRRWAEQGLLWVAQDGARLIGFAACEAFDDALHLWELAVRRDVQQRGAGRRLLDACVAEARRRGLAAVTLTTFREIPWNAPFYARYGFVEVTGRALNRRLRAIRVREASLGLDVEARCAMRLVL